MKSLAKFVCVCACLALAGPLAAQDPTIVVEGEVPAEPDEVRELVQKLASTQRADMPAIRYFDALCLSVHGLNPAGNAYVRERIYENAAEIGVGNSGEECMANALVLIHDDPEALIAQIIKDVPDLIPSAKRDDVNKQLAEGSQIIVWHNERDYDLNGRPGVLNSAIPGDNTVNGQMSMQAQININGWPSRTQLGFSRAVVSAAIILDGDIVEGMEINRLADYAMMRLMAPGLIPLEDETPIPTSITAPFPKETGVSALTRFDRAYLNALYSMRPNAPAPRLAERVAEVYGGED